MSPMRRQSDHLVSRALTRSQIGMALIGASVGLHLAGMLGEHVVMALIGIGGLMVNGEAVVQRRKDRKAMNESAEQRTP